MAIVPTDIPMTSQVCGETLRRLAQQYPALKLRTLTTTPAGREVWHLTLGEGERQVIYTAAHHANEWITATVLLQFLESLLQALAAEDRIFGVPAQTLVRASTLHFVPMVDPDGVDLVTGAIGPGSAEYDRARRIAEDFPQIPFPDGWKADLQGVDLNLQYPAGWLQAREIKFSQGYTRPAPRDFVGRAPLTQREVRALAALTQELEPSVALALHTQGRVIYWQFRNYRVPGARELAEEFARLSGYALEEPAYASAFAGYKDWVIQNFRRPAFTIELGQGENPLPLSQLDTLYREALGILVTAATGLPGGV